MHTSRWRSFWAGLRQGFSLDFSAEPPRTRTIEPTTGAELRAANAAIAGDWRQIGKDFGAVGHSLQRGMARASEEAKHQKGDRRQ